jgi:hypothetical protein
MGYKEHFSTGHRVNDAYITTANDYFNATDEIFPKQKK